MNFVTFTSYKIPEKRLRDHFEWNHADYLYDDVHVIINVDKEYAGLPSYVSQYVYPWPVTVYSAPRMTNYVLRRIVDSLATGDSRIVRTDVDIAFDGILGEVIEATEERTAMVPLYFMAKSYSTRKEPCYCAYRAEGTVSMLARNWNRLRGYNEGMVGYTCDDGDMIVRIREADIHIVKYHHVYHIAHGDGPQQDSWTPGASGMGRTDQWNRDIHPFNMRHNLFVQNQMPRWDNPLWGYIGYPKGV